MKFLPIILASVLALGTITFAQETNQEPTRSEKPVIVEFQKQGNGPWMQRGEMRGGPRGPMMQHRGRPEFRNEMQMCPLCKQPMKHQMRFRGGDRSEGRQHRGR